MALSRNSTATFKVCANCDRQVRRRVRICSTCFPHGEYRRELRDKSIRFGKTFNSVWREPTEEEIAQRTEKNRRLQATVDWLIGGAA